MLEQQRSVNDFTTVEELINYDKQFPEPNSKVYFDDKLIMNQNEETSIVSVKMLSDYFEHKTGQQLLINDEYGVNITHKNKKQSEYGLEERDNFANIETIIVIQNIVNKRSFVLSFGITSEMFEFSLFKNYNFYEVHGASRDRKKEFTGFIQRQTYYTIGFCELIYDYLELGIIDLEANVKLIKTH